MKKFLPLAAAGVLAAACNMADNDRVDNRTGMRTDLAPGYVVTPAPAVVAPTTVVRQDGTYYYREDGTYYVQPTVVAQPGVVAVPGYQHKHADDALSDRTLGASRDVHGNPMTHKDIDNDGNYDFQPYYSPYVPYYGPRRQGYYYVY